MINVYLHVADGDAVVSAIPNHLVLDLLPALHTLLHEHLRASRERLHTQRLELMFVLCETRTEPAKSVGRANDDGVPDSARSHDCLVDRRRGARLRAAFADLCHSAREQLAILGHDDGVDGCSEHLASKRFELVLELDTDIQRRLTAERDVDSVRLLVLNDLAHELWRHWEEVYLSQIRISVFFALYIDRSKRTLSAKPVLVAIVAIFGLMRTV